MHDSSPTKVVVVLDGGYGQRLRQREINVPVWIVDTPTNRAVAEQLWAEEPQQTHFTGVTTFKASAPSPEETLLDQIDTIDLHHPSFTDLEVVGVPLTERIRAELKEYRFSQFREITNGFLAIRSSQPPLNR